MATKRTLAGALQIAACQLVLLMLLRLLSGGGGLIALPAALVVGGAIGTLLMQRTGAVWPEPARASVLATLGQMALFAALLPEYSPLGGGVYPGAWRDRLLGILTMLAAGGAGTFIMPLLPRGGGEALAVHVRLRTTGMAALAAILVSAAIQALLVPGAGGGIGTLALGVLVIGGLGGLGFAGLGLLLTLAGAQRSGAWAGGFGLLAGALSVVVWIAAGQPWFP